MKFKDWFFKSNSPQKESPDKKPIPAGDISAAESDQLESHSSLPVNEPSHFGTEPTHPFTRERIVSLFLEKDYKFSYDKDGDLVGVWDGFPFWFVFIGPQKDFLQIRGRWHRNVPHSSRHEMMHAMNDWNRDRSWPKAYLREEDDGTSSAVFGEMTFDYSVGVTEKQLRYNMDYALHTCLQLFTHLNSLLPPENGEPPAEDN